MVLRVSPGHRLEQFTIINVGPNTVVDENYPPLSRERLNWVGHNYLRSATHAAANVRLVKLRTHRCLWPKPGAAKRWPPRT